MAKKKMKPDLTPGNPWSTRHEIGTHDQKRKAVMDRITATKKNSKKKMLRAKYAGPKETPLLKAQRAQAAKEAARKVFEQWLESPKINEFAANHSRHPTLASYVHFALEDAIPTDEE